MASPDQYPKEFEEEYSDESSLNTLNVYLPRPHSKADSNKLWIIYIHGGAWRDPAITSSSFSAIRSKLLSFPTASSIAGYASINYRLSSYPSHPTDPSNPSDPARNAIHPTHINDLLTALLYLQEKYSFDDRYILVGHSCGATLAFQVAMKRYWGSQYESTFALEMNVVPPIAIVGLEGIYDIPALVKRHEDQSVYRDFIVNAFGSSGWDVVSPVRGDFEEGWVDGRLVVLAHSEGDSLVEREQADGMRGALVQQRWSDDDGDRKIKMFELEGEHDEVWETGDAARAVECAVKDVVGRKV